MTARRGDLASLDRAFDQFAAFMPETQALGSAETLNYLHDRLSARRHPVAVPSMPMSLHGLFADTPLGPRS